VLTFPVKLSRKGKGVFSKKRLFPTINQEVSMSVLQEFKEFAMKGNVVDMAVGIVIGAAFGGVVNSLVNDIIMPPLGYVIGGMDFNNLEFILKPAIGEAPVVSIKYGIFINKLINFLVIAVSMFFVIKAMNHLGKIRIKKQ
jgi:large conductance mechanosensitive channel